MLHEGVESLSDGIHRIHRTRTDSDEKVYVLFVRYTWKNFTHVGLAYRESKVVPMESIGSIGHELIPMEPIDDRNTFKLRLFCFGNGCAPQLITHLVLL